MTSLTTQISVCNSEVHWTKGFGGDDFGTLFHVGKPQLQLKMKG